MGFGYSKCSRTQAGHSIHLVFKFAPESAADAKLKLKVEINTREHGSLADANAMVLDALEEYEQEIMLKANRERVAWEKKIRDPDDCYLDVMNREEELRREGQPSQLGFLFGMRRLSRSEILSGSFEERGEAESDAEDALRSRCRCFTDLIRMLARYANGTKWIGSGSARYLFEMLNGSRTDPVRYRLGI